MNVWNALRSTGKSVDDIAKSTKWIDDLGIIEKDFKNKIVRWVKEGLDETKLEKTFTQMEDKVKLFSELDNAKSLNHQRVIINDYENISGITKGKYISNSVDNVKENITRKIVGKEFILKTNQAKTFVKNAKLSNRKDIEIIEDLGNGIQFVKIKPGTKLYRVFDGYKPWDNISQTGNTLPKGNYWTFEKPNSISEVIEGTAVMPEWNGMTKIIEIEIPKDGIFVWRGLAARQPASSSTKDFFLKGGTEQVIFDIKQNNMNISEITQSIKEMK